MATDQETIDGVHAYIAYRRVDAMKRRLLEDIAEQFSRAGRLDPDEVWERFDALWVEPTDEYLADVVAAKCAAAIEQHDKELEWFSTEVERIENARTRGENRDAELANAEEEDQHGRVEFARAVAVDLLEAAPGDPAGCPTSGAVNAGEWPRSSEVAQFVDRLIREGR